MRLMSLKQYMKMSKPALIRKITKALRAMPKKRLAVLCYNITKSKLPRLRNNVRALKALRTEAFIHAGDKKRFEEIIAKQDVIKRRISKRKTKRKFSRKQLAAQRLFAKRARAGTLRRR